MSKLRVLLGSVAVSVGVLMVMGLVGVAAPAQADLGSYKNTGTYSLGNIYMRLISGTFDLDECGQAAIPIAEAEYGVTVETPPDKLRRSDEFSCNVGFTEVPPPPTVVFTATLDAPTYALAGSELTYDLSVKNRGLENANKAIVTLTFDDDEMGAVAPESLPDNCSGDRLRLICIWPANIVADNESDWSTSVTVTVPSSASSGNKIDAELKVTDADSGATASASATTTVDAKPDLRLRMTSSPRKVVAPGAEVDITILVSNRGSVSAKDVVVTLPTDTATFASATAGGTLSGDDVVWPAISKLWPMNGETAPTLFQATLTAGADGTVILTKASATGTTDNGFSYSGTSDEILLRVTNEAEPELTAAFEPESFRLGKDIALKYEVTNYGSAPLSPGKLVVPIPTGTSLVTEPAGAVCDTTACTIPVTAVAAGATSAASLALTVDADFSLTRLEAPGTLKPDTEGAFSNEVATARADLQVTSDIVEVYEISIDPPAGSGCSLGSSSAQKDLDVDGFTLVRDELLIFTITGCETGASVPVEITVQGDPLPEGAIAIKTDGSGAGGTPISGATISGNTLRYTLTDNGPLDLDTDDGELSDPVAVALAGGGGIYIPLITPVPIPYWVLGLLAGLMSWLGYRRLRLVW